MHICGGIKMFESLFKKQSMVEKRRQEINSYADMLSSELIHSLQDEFSIPEKLNIYVEQGRIRITKEVDSKYYKEILDTKGEGWEICDVLCNEIVKKTKGYFCRQSNLYSNQIVVTEKGEQYSANKKNEIYENKRRQFIVSKRKEVQELTEKMKNNIKVQQWCEKFVDMDIEIRTNRIVGCNKDKSVEIRFIDEECPNLMEDDHKYAMAFAIMELMGDVYYDPGMITGEWGELKLVRKNKTTFSW